MISMSRRGLLLTIALLLAASQAIASSGEGAEGTFPGYMKIDPSLIVNMSRASKAKYMRVDIQLYIATKEEADLVAHHMPRIRDRLISLLGGRNEQSLETAQQRDALRAELLTALQENMTAQTGRPAISALYFTGFIVQ